jgi:hypothetical protein
MHAHIHGDTLIIVYSLGNTKGLRIESKALAAYDKDPADLPRETAGPAVLGRESADLIYGTWSSARSGSA